MLPFHHLIVLILPTLWYLGRFSTSETPSLHIYSTESFTWHFFRQKFASGINWSQFPGIVVIPNTFTLDGNKEQKEINNTTDSYPDHHLWCHICVNLSYATNELDQQVFYNDISDYNKYNTLSNNTSEINVTGSTICTTMIKTFACW